MRLKTLESDMPTRDIRVASAWCAFVICAYLYRMHVSVDILELAVTCSAVRGRAQFELQIDSQFDSWSTRENDRGDLGFIGVGIF